VRLPFLKRRFADIEYIVNEYPVSNDPDGEIQRELRRRVNDLRDELVEELMSHEGATESRRRMTNAQRDRLWTMCGNYGVNFNENDYYIDAATGWVEGWIGGRNHAAGYGDQKPTIFTGVSMEGESHT
jgi:hypothetical protein